MDIKVKGDLIMKLLKQLENIEVCPKEALNIAFLINFKMQTDTFYTKAKCELILDNLSDLEVILKANSINNQIVKREIEKIKEEMYNKINFFKKQEKLIA